jgi:hypothetical protein
MVSNVHMALLSKRNDSLFQHHHISIFSLVDIRFALPCSQGSGYSEFLLLYGRKLDVGSRYIALR